MAKGKGIWIAVGTAAAVATVAFVATRAKDPVQSAFGFTVKFKGPALLPQTQDATAKTLSALGLNAATIATASVFQADDGENAIQFVTKTGMPKPVLPPPGTTLLVLGVPLAVDTVVEASALT